MVDRERMAAELKLAPGLFLIQEMTAMIHQIRKQKGYWKLQFLGVYVTRNCIR